MVENVTSITDYVILFDEWDIVDTLGGRAKLKKYLFLMPMASLGKKKFL